MTKIAVATKTLIFVKLRQNLINTAIQLQTIMSTRSVTQLFAVHINDTAKIKASFSNNVYITQKHL